MTLPERPRRLKSDGKWTDDAKAYIKHLWDLKYPAAGIAKVIGTTRNTILGLAHREGWERRVIAQRKNEAKRNASASIRTSQTAKAAPVPRVHVPRASRVRTPVPQHKTQKLPASVIRRPPKLVSIMELRSGICRWPIGDPTEKGFGFCGHDVETPGSPYCELHMAERTWKKKEGTNG